MTINWIKCSERMPPDDHSEIILKKNGEKCLWALGFTANRDKNLLVHEEWYWIPYTEEAWKELSK